MLVFIALPKAEQTVHRTHAYSHIECDAPKCGKRAPSPSEMGNKSLQELGWHIAGGQHRCPEHVDVETAPGGPVYRDK